jgi:hypothetical protein
MLPVGRFAQPLSRKSETFGAIHSCAAGCKGAALKPMRIGLEAWRETMKSRVDEALATLAHEGAETESWFRVKIHGQDYFLWYEFFLK